MIEEDWKVLVSLLPADWREKAKETEALKGLRKNKSEENLLRTLFIHIAQGLSLRETAVRAREAQLADMSDVALLKRLRKCSKWLAELNKSLFDEIGVHFDPSDKRFEIRIFDSTTVKEPGKTGSLWRIHYSLMLPSLQCDFFKVTPMEGHGTGDSFSQFVIKPGDHIMADRGYGRKPGIEFVAQKQAALLVRISPHHLTVMDENGQPFDWLKKLSEMDSPGQTFSWNVMITGPNKTNISGRICILRKSEHAICIAHKRIKKHASKKCQKLMPETLIYAKYVIVFTTFEETSFSSEEVMHWYRLRWQIELVFKRFKQIAQLGHLPKYTDESSKAWLYGKLLIALLTEKLIWQAQTFSPWGYSTEKKRASQPLA
jgi:hypothetical protein